MTRGMDADSSASERNSPGQWLLGLGVFLTPFTRVLPVEGVGVSIGDMVLFAGTLLVLTEPRRVPRGVHANWMPIVMLTGVLVVFGTALSALMNQASSMSESASLLAQYTAVLLALPLALSRLSLVRIVSYVRLWCFGMATMIVVGLAIVLFLPGPKDWLEARNWLFSVGGDARYGLFAGIGELAKMAAVTIALIYFLVALKRLKALSAGLLISLMVVAVIVARAGSGVIALGMTVAALILLHLLLARGHARRSGGRIGIALLVAGIFASVGLSFAQDAGVDFLSAFEERVLAPFQDEGLSGVGSYEMRGGLLVEAWGIIADNAAFGVGPGQYHELSASGQGVHVVPLMLWAETGFLPFVGWVVLVAGLVLVISKSQPDVRHAKVAAFVVLLMFVLMTLSTPYMYGRGTILTLLLIVPLLGIQTSGSKDPELTRGSSLSRAKRGFG